MSNSGAISTLTRRSRDCRSRSLLRTRRCSPRHGARSSPIGARRASGRKRHVPRIGGKPAGSGACLRQTSRISEWRSAARSLCRVPHTKDIFGKTGQLFPKASRAALSAEFRTWNHTVCHGVLYRGALSNKETFRPLSIAWANAVSFNRGLQRGDDLL